MIKEIDLDLKTSIKDAGVKVEAKELSAINSLLHELFPEQFAAHSYHLPGQHDQCDHSPTGECIEEEPQGERSAMFKTEREIIKNKQAESGAFYDSSGAFLGSLKGGRDTITIN